MLKVPRCTAFGRFTLNGGAEHERQTQTGRHLYTFHTEKLRHASALAFILNANPSSKIAREFLLLTSQILLE